MYKEDGIYENNDVTGGTYGIEIRNHDTVRPQSSELTGSGSVKSRHSRAALVCLVLLCLLLLTVVIVLGVVIYTNNTNYTQERNNLVANITEVKDELLTRNSILTGEKQQLLIQIETVTQERDQLKSDKNELQMNFGQVLQLAKSVGWTYYQTSLYFVSSEMKNWTESRRYCTERGADLTIINDRQKQGFSVGFSHYNSFWIGLTDIGEEGRWKWVDGSNMTSGFWAFTEPNGGTRENCARIASTGWADYPCNVSFNWICEKIIFK